MSHVSHVRDSHRFPDHVKKDMEPGLEEIRTRIGDI